MHFFAFAVRASRRAACFLWPALMSLAVLPAAAQTSVTHAAGTTVVPAAPKSVLVFDLASLDTLQALGVEVKGVPTAKFPPQLAKYAGKGYVKVGSLFEPDYEAVNAARPDLIIIGGRSAAKYPELSKLAPTIDMTVSEKDHLGSIYSNAQTLGRIFGKEAQAKALIEKAQSSVAALKVQAAKSGKGMVVLTTGGKMSAYGPGARFGAVMHDTFGVPAAQARLNASNHGQAISNEFILQTNPEWLFVIDRDAAIGREGTSAQRLLDNELVRQTTAWKKQQVVYLDAVNWYVLGGAGLPSLQANVDQLSAALKRGATTAR
ncbi:MAG: siderophore ABC transporter substrate-binding protein [Haliea sp.]|nr:MAG: siderophore ABC transporter substrate-binding protein [Haliea sp.]